MATLAPAAARSAQGPVPVDLLMGVRLEVADLDAAHIFYDLIFRDAAGEWRQDGRALTYQAGPQSIEFVRRARPRTFSDGGQHQAYRVRAARLPSLLDELAAAGARVEWWREDHPAERAVGPYLQDPSGNWVQLMASDDSGPLLAHAAIEIHEFDYCEYLYVRELGGGVEYYCGWRIEDQEEARAWGAGDDPCAPWTRRDNPGWNDFRDQGTRDPNLRVPRPNTQLFIQYGRTLLGLISATKTRQEPPEEQITGTPRLIFRARQSAANAAAYLATEPIPFERRAQSIFLRDPDGNFVELRCDS